MFTLDMDRREFVKSLLMSIPAFAFDWSVFPRAVSASQGDDWDAVIIGSGLGGLACAAAFARQGYRALVLEQHDKPGGYATCFKRPGGFEFDVSLHSTVVGERDGSYNLIPGFPEITSVDFVPHPSLYRAIYPDYDITIPQRDVAGYVKILKSHFPDEHAGIDAIVAEMKGIRGDVNRLTSVQGEVDYSQFAAEFPHLFKAVGRTWGQIVDEHLTNPRLKAIVSAQWGYYGLPPSKLASFYYALPAIGYLEGGGYYPKGKSQAISDAFVEFIEKRGGKVLLETRVERILVENRAARGVVTADGKSYRGRVVVSNANSYDTFHTMVGGGDFLEEYLARMDNYTVSLSSFQVWLGLKNDIVKSSGITDSEIFYEPGYDPDATFKALMDGDVDQPGFGVTLYDNLLSDYSPPGKNTVNIIALHGYDYWKQYETDYLAGNKDAYRKEKERIADHLIDQVEEILLPGLRGAVEIRVVATPLTNLRYTGNYRGAIYGWDQTLNNAMPSRLPHVTPVENLFLAGAWTQPGGGYGGVIYSGLQCFGEVMKRWG
jgi:all-trans-retinol 13,14-reductase